MTQIARRLAEELVVAARALNPSGASRSTSGNVSVRLDRQKLLITPSGLAYDDMTAGDVVMLGLEEGPAGGPQVLAGTRAPSSEWRIHRDLLRARPELGAIVHTHSMFATTLACLRQEIPAFHYMVAIAGGDSIRCARYATFGTKELAENVLAALENRKACLLANHGMLAVGADLACALRVAEEVETLAAQYWRVLQIGPPELLDADEMARVLVKFETYTRIKSE